MKINDVRRAAYAMPLTNPAARALPLGGNNDPGRLARACHLQLFRHVAADVARLPVREVISGSHFVADLTLGYGKTSTRLIGHPQFGRNFGVSRSSPATLTRFVIGLVIMALIVIGLTNPSGAQTSGLRIESTISSTQQHDGIPTLFVRCLHDWDAGTHMTKKEWSAACQRLLIERGVYKYRQ
jgi:hypothetical protein